MPRILKLFLKVVSVLFLVLFLAVVATVLFFPKEKAKSLFLSKVDEAGVVLKFETMDFKFGIPMGLRMEGVAFQSKEGVSFGGYGFSGHTHELVVSVDWLRSLLSLSLHSKVFLNTPDIQVLEHDVAKEGPLKISPQMLFLIERLQVSLEIVKGRFGVQGSTMKFALKEVDVSLTMRGLRRENKLKASAEMTPSTWKASTFSAKLETTLRWEIKKVSPFTMDVRDVSLAMSKLALQHPRGIVEEGSVTYALPKFLLQKQEGGWKWRASNESIAVASSTLIYIDKSGNRSMLAEPMMQMNTKDLKGEGALGLAPAAFQKLNGKMQAKWLRRNGKTQDLTDWPFTFVLEQTRYNHTKKAISISDSVISIAKYDIPFSLEGNLLPLSLSLIVLASDFHLAGLQPLSQSFFPDLQMEGVAKLDQPLQVDVKVIKGKKTRKNQNPIDTTQIKVNGPSMWLRGLKIQKGSFSLSEPPLGAEVKVTYAFPQHRLKLEKVILKRQTLNLPIDGNMRLSPLTGTLNIGKATFPLSETPSYVLRKLGMENVKGDVNITQPIKVAFDLTNPSKPSWNGTGEVKVREVGFSHQKADVQGSETTFTFKGPKILVNGNLQKMLVKSQLAPVLPVIKGDYHLVVDGTAAQIQKSTVHFLDGTYTVSKGRYDLKKRRLGLDLMKYSNDKLSKFIDWYQPEIAGAVEGKLFFQTTDVSQRLNEHYDPIRSSLRGHGYIEIEDFVWTTLPLEEEVNAFIKKSLSGIALLSPLVKNQDRFVGTDFKGGVNECRIDFVLEGEKANVTKLLIQNADGILKGTGTVGVYDLKLNLELVYESFKAGQFLSGNLKNLVADPNGHVMIPLRLQGTMKHPTVAFHAERFIQPIQQKAIKQLQQKAVEEVIPDQLLKDADNLLKNLFRP